LEKLGLICLLLFGLGLLLEGVGLIEGKRFSEDDEVKKRWLFLITGPLIIIYACVRLAML
jgi:hypothetical protein